MPHKPYIFRSEPVYSPRVWGGRRLESLYAKALPDEVPIGESWEVADLPEGQSLVGNGPLSGMTLGELVARFGDALVGTQSAGLPTSGKAMSSEARREFPLLVKLLDAHDDLSIQVHPGEEHLARFDGARSKDECWLILAAEPGACVIHGFDAPADAATFRRDIERGHALARLRRLEVAPGDVIRVAPGTIHAICRGVMLLEIQQPSDTTFRVYDYERPGLDGRPRALHLDEALAVASWQVQPDARQPVTRLPGEGAELELLADVPAYRVERLRTTRKLSWRVDPRSVQIVFAVGGAVRLSSAGGEPVELLPGQTAIVPACMGQVDARPLSAGEADLVVAGLGGRLLVDLVPEAAIVAAAPETTP